LFKLFKWTTYNYFYSSDFVEGLQHMVEEFQLPLSYVLLLMEVCLFHCRLFGFLGFHSIYRYLILMVDIYLKLICGLNLLDNFGLFLWRVWKG
jgi:hypothetical protein